MTFYVIVFTKVCPLTFVAANSAKCDLEEIELDDNGKVTKKLKDQKDTKDKHRDLGEMVKNSQTN